MDCIVYIDLFFLLNFWMNLLIIFLVRKLIKSYRTIRCVIAAFLEAAVSCGLLLLFFQTESMAVFLIHIPVLFLVNFMAFGCKNMLWHLLLFILTGAATGGIQTAIFSLSTTRSEGPVILLVSLSCFLACAALEKQCRLRWKEEHMKAKTVLEFENRKMFATALIDTGNKLYDPFFHKPVILVDERMMRDIVLCCKESHPEKLQYIPYHSVGRMNGMLEGVMFDRVSIQWQEKKLMFNKVIAAATKENLYKGKEYQVIFHCGLLEEI